MKGVSRESARTPAGAAARGLLRWPLYLTSVALLIPFGSMVWWPLELFCHFGMHLLWVLVIFVVIALYARQWWRLCWVVLLAAVALARVYPAADELASTTPPEEAYSLSVISLNISRYNRDVDALDALVTTERPDVVVLLEVNRWWDEALSSRLAGWPHRVVHVEENAFGLGIYARHPLTPVHVGPVVEGTPPVVSVDVVRPEGTLRLVGIHTNPPITARWRWSRDQELAVLSEELAQVAGPVALCGDFNLTPYSPIFHRLVSVSGLRDARGPHERQSTWPTWLGRLGIPIDHCLVSREVASTGSVVLPSVGSDHAPIRVDLALPGGVGVRP